ncbi:AMP-binding protein [candidate division KSB3 bacterium]|uniref:AMP-binding protein n=1 Tax=candidate division KSB3 bacterium TaxID=2044937 RepID=A0A9D5Q690_9BACT|nr:AMP-binding protein [candidate division KSB3 bacterium]MBD3325589.1 AMP-binding protein [candidate division KSB3 bacterium]
MDSSPVLSYDQLYRIVADLVSAELSTLRGQTREEAQLKGGPQADLLGTTDSLERLELAAAVNAMFQLHKTGLEDALLRYRRLSKWVEIVERCWQEHHEEITFLSSGSSGRPKHCPHQLVLLLQEVQTLAAIFADRTRILAMVPAHHIYGFLFTLLLPHVAEVPVIDGRYLAIGTLAQTLKPGDLIVSFPANWAYLQRSLPCFPSDVWGVTSTAPCDAGLIHALREQGLTQMIEVYGSSETAGIGSRTMPDSPYTLFPYWQRSATQEEGTFSLIRTLPDGTSSNDFQPPDLLEWHSERTFSPVKRLDNAVQIGGINVYPQRVAQKILTHPKVKACAVRLFTLPATDRLKAFIVPVDGIDEATFRAELEAWLSQHFAAPEKPVRLTFGSELPHNHLGKLTDW